MQRLTTTELADQLGVTKGRVSQYVSEGKLSGCYSGDGRQRRFDLAACAAALGRRLDPGQMMGNGSATRKVISELVSGSETPKTDQTNRRGGATELPMQDPDRYELARTQKAEEEARALRRKNAEAEGLFVLASEVDRQVSRVVGQEIAEFEAVMRDGARVIADRMGVDFKSVRKLLLDTWRAHRAERADHLSRLAGAAAASDDERREDI